MQRFKITTSTIEEVEVEAENIIEAKVSVIMGNIEESCVKKREMEILKAEILRVKIRTGRGKKNEIRAKNKNEIKHI